MKLIIDVDEKLVCEGFERPFTEEERDTLIRAIGNAKSYNPSGDAISREALKDLAYINKGNFNTVEGIREWIDNAPAVEPAFKSVAEIKVTLTEEEKQKFIEEFQKQRLVCGLPETQMEITTGKCPIEASGDCPLRSKGEWILQSRTPGFFGRDAQDNFKCSVCGKITSHTFVGVVENEITPYCPQCGAKMLKGSVKNEY